MSKERVQATVWRCVCEVQGCQRNGSPWLSLADRPPKVCPTCRSREWGDYSVIKRRLLAARTPLHQATLGYEG